jgi:hypothetical protein
MPFMESGADKVLKDVLGKKLCATTDKKVISESYFVICAKGIFSANKKDRLRCRPLFQKSRNFLIRTYT